MPKPTNRALADPPECFVIMPIGDREPYQLGHFKWVYDTLIAPACRDAGFAPLRADDVAESNLIHHDILARLLNAPMAVCDLSSANPNVLFELGFRQAFDMPVALIQEPNTPQIFDVGPLRTLRYRISRIYDEVVEDRKELATFIRKTYQACNSGEGVNSLVRLLALTSTAKIGLQDGENRQTDFQSITLSELGRLGSEIQKVRDILTNDYPFADLDAALENSRLVATLEGLEDQAQSLVHLKGCLHDFIQRYKRIAWEYGRIAERLHQLPIGPASRLRANYLIQQVRQTLTDARGHLDGTESEIDEILGEAP